MDMDIEKVRRNNALLELGQDLHLMAAAKKHGGDKAAEYLNELLGKPTRERARRLNEDLPDDEGLEARALAVYQDYETLVHLITEFEVDRLRIHANFHQHIERIQSGLTGDTPVICLECAGVLSRHLLAQGVAVTPW